MEFKNVQIDLNVHFMLNIKAYEASIGRPIVIEREYSSNI